MYDIPNCLKGDVCMAIGNNIKRLRVSKNISLRKLALMAGVSKTTVNEIENNIVVNPTYDTLQKIADALGVPLGLLTSKDDTIKEISDNLFDLAEFNGLDGISEQGRKQMLGDLIVQEPELIYQMANDKYLGPLTIDEYSALKAYLKIYREGKK
jgi:transcriptional regulator with XRE-family HTH domain